MKLKMIFQKLLGITLIILGIISIKLARDGTFALLIIPIGVNVTITKDYILIF